MREKFVVPAFNADAFHCPHCEVYAHQTWYAGIMSDNSGYRHFPGKNELSINVCSRCQNYALWVNGVMIYPVSSNAPLPLEDIPQNVKEDFIEARSVVNISPRAASALLRLSLQKLMVSLGEKGEDLNKDIGNLVKKGMPATIQQALDCVRVIGNNAVHPGELDLKDDSETALALFGLVNMIVTVMVSQPKEVNALYGKIPKGAQEAIVKRDKNEHS